MPIGNNLLLRLPQDERARLARVCTRQMLPADVLVYASGAPMEHVWFPSGAVFGLVAPLARTAGVHVGLVGQESLLISPRVIGPPLSPLEVQTRIGGAAWRITATGLRALLQYAPVLDAQIDRINGLRVTQVAQIAACTRYHTVEMRLARWLLMLCDSCGSPGFRLKQRVLANMLGARRAGVSIAAAQLRRRGLLSYSRGIIQLRDRIGLEQAACSCYRWMRNLDADSI